MSILKWFIIVIAIVPVIMMSVIIFMLIILWGNVERLDERASWLEDVALGHYKVTKVVNHGS